MDWLIHGVRQCTPQVPQMLTCCEVLLSFIGLFPIGKIVLDPNSLVF